ncbi:hypothetical protein PMEGAPL125_00470 [Priestia megaterium]
MHLGIKFIIFIDRLSVKSNYERPLKVMYFYKRINQIIILVIKMKVSKKVLEILKSIFNTFL